MHDSVDFKAITKALSQGGIAVVRTDTLYGIIALASDEAAVEKVYTAKSRDPSKQCIILLADAPTDSTYGSLIQTYSQEAANPTSVVVPATSEASWLLRGGTTIAYRVVRDSFLKAVIEAVGPVIAPSANPEGLPPARTIDEARAYFGDTVDCYVDGGEVPQNVPASDIITVDEKGAITTIRGTAQPNLPTRHSSGGLIFHEGKVLLIHWAPPRSTYDFPKGTIEHGETSEQACIREVFEETGYRTRIVRYIGSNEFDFQTPSGQYRHKINDYYLLELEDTVAYDAQREPHETFENVWVPVDDALTIITRDINKAIFAKALSLQSS
jgi:L-threonylcarbamoyladenylate synthase